MITTKLLAYRHTSGIRTLFISVLLLSLLTTGYAADVYYIQARLGTAGDLCGDPAYKELNGTWSNSGSRSSQDPWTGTGCRFGYVNTCSIRLSPTNLAAGATYQLDTTHIGINASPNLIVGITYENCTGTVSSSDAFQATYANIWKEIGRITVNPLGLRPNIIITYSSGTIASSGGRWYSDAYRFTDVSDPCVDALPQVPTVTGPLAEGQTYVDVPGITNTAVGVHVYADGIKIGSLTSGVTGGVNRVPTLALIKDQVITATQNDATEIESCRPEVGQNVGGGANPQIRISLNIRQNTALTGPIGANGGTATAPLKFLGATNVAGGLGNAPLGGKLVTPAPCWQTVSFLRGGDPYDPVDPSYVWAQSDGTNVILGDFGVLESIAFAIDDLSNTGPFQIYIDNIRNGSTVIQDFESASDGQSGVLFLHPFYSGSTSPFLLDAPDISQVTTNNAEASANSALISFQFKKLIPAAWVRLITQGTLTPNPEVDLRLPISFSILLMPVGQTNAGLPFTATGPTNQTFAAGTTATLSTVPTGNNPMTYRWFKDGIELSGETAASLSIPGITYDQSGVYGVEINGPCNSVTNFAMITVVPAPAFSNCSYNAANGTFSLSLGTVSGLLYLLEYKDNLTDPSWTLLETIPGDGNPATFNYDVSSQPTSRFYRLRIQ